MPNQEYEILEALPEQPKESKLKKYGPAIFWGTLMALPAMNLAASVLDYKTAQLQLEIERLREAAEKVK